MRPRIKTFQTKPDKWETWYYFTFPEKTPYSYFVESYSCKKDADLGHDEYERELEKNGSILLL